MTISAETEDEVLRQAVEHAREKHGVDLTQSTTLVNYAKDLVRDEGAPPQSEAAAEAN